MSRAAGDVYKRQKSHHNVGGLPDDMKLIVNPKDVVSLMRIVNVPRRRRCV